MKAVKLSAQFLLMTALLWMPVNSEAFPFGKKAAGLEESAQAAYGPGGMTITPDGSYIISCHQFFDPEMKVIRMDKDEMWQAFPNRAMNTGEGNAPLVLDSVLGVECDKDGIVWMLDNGRRSEKQPKLVAWNTKKNRLHRVIPITEAALIETSFLDDLALDPEEPFIYLADPAAGDDAALIVVDLVTGLSRRVLHGDHAVRAEKIGLRMDGQRVTVKRPDGRQVQPLGGVNPIAVDKKGKWLFFGPMNGRILYQIPTKDLRNPALLEEELTGRIKRVSGQKPIASSMSIDSKGNIYFADIQRHAITYISVADQRLHELVTDPRILWPDGLTFGTDGKLHFFTSQLNRSAIFNGGKDRSQPPYWIFKIKAKASGTVGR
ncbi:MAG: major royal jelly family protein [Verrucomicrobiales bacterium]|nr:major royal jelly family protein [Verrucomicrobiales bacterium]